MSCVNLLQNKTLHLFPVIGINLRIPISVFHNMCIESGIFLIGQLILIGKVHHYHTWNLCLIRQIHGQHIIFI